MGADSLAENTPNAPKFICPICLPKPKSLGFQWKKASLGVCSPWANAMQIYCRHSPLWIQEVVVECYVPHLALLYLTIVWTGCSSIRSDQYIIPYQARMIIIIPCGMAAPFTPCSTSFLAWPMWVSWMEQRFVSRASLKMRSFDYLIARDNEIQGCRNRPDRPDLGTEVRFASFFLVYLLCP